MGLKGKGISSGDSEISVIRFEGEPGSNEKVVLILFKLPCSERSTEDRLSSGGGSSSGTVADIGIEPFAIICRRARCIGSG